MRPAWALVVLAACGSTLRYDLDLVVQVKSLQNGVRVVVLPDDTSELVAIVAHYDVGEAADPPGERGLAHLAEHVSFEAPAGRQTIAAGLNAHTLFSNGFTFPGATVFTALVRPEDVGRVLELEAARLRGGCRAVPPAVFARERAVVIDEARERGNRGRITASAVASLFPQTSPWSHTIEEQERDVPAIAQAEVCRYLDEQYVSERVIVTIAGHITAADGWGEAARWLGGVARRAPVPLPARPPAAPIAPRKTFEWNQVGAAVFVAWPLPPEVPGEVLPFLVAMLDDQNKLVHRAFRFALYQNAEIVGDAQGRYLVASAQLITESEVQGAIECFATAVERPMVAGVVGFDGLRYALLVDLYLQWEGLLPRAMAAAKAARYGGDPSLGRYVRRVRDITQAEVLAVRDKWLTRDRMLIRIVLPGGDRGRPASAPSPAAPPVPPPDVDEPAPEGADAPTAAGHPFLPGIRTVTLANGLEVVLAPRPSPFPAVSTRLVFFAGAAHVPPELRGVAEATAAVLESPPRRYTVKGGLLIEDPLVIAGAHRRSAVTMDYTMFSADGIAESVPQLVEGLGGWATADIQPSDELFLGAASFVLRRLPTLWDLRLQAILEDRVYGAAHPYGRVGIAGHEDILKLRLLDMALWQAARYCAGNAAVVVAGAFDPDKAEAAIRAVYGDWPRCERTPKVVDAPAPRARAEVVAVASEQPIVEASIAYPSGPGGDGKQAARLVLAEMLARQMRAVRERLGASYGVSALHEDRVGPGMFVISGALDPRRAAEALAEVRRGIDALHRDADVRRHFAAARRAVRSRLTANISVGQIADTLAGLIATGRRPEDMAALGEAVARLGPDDIVALAQAELVPARATVVVRGPAAVVAALTWDGRKPTMQP